MIHSNVHSTRGLAIHQNFKNNLLKSHPTLPVVYHIVKGGKGSSYYKTRSKMSKIIDLESTGIRRFARLASKLKQKYGIFAKFSLAVVRAYMVDKIPHFIINNGKTTCSRNKYTYLRNSKPLRSHGIYIKSRKMNPTKSRICCCNNTGHNLFCQ